MQLIKTSNHTFNLDNVCFIEEIGDAFRLNFYRDFFIVLEGNDALEFKEYLNKNSTSLAKLNNTGTFSSQ